MKITDSFELAFRCIASKKKRTFLNILGIMIGVASVVTILCVGQGGEAAVSGKLDKMGMNAVAIKTNPTSSETMKYKDYEYLKTVMKDVTISPVYMNYATLEADGISREVVVWGVSGGFEDIYNLNLSSGRFFNENDIRRKSKIAILEGSVAEKFLGGGSVDKLRLSIRGKSMAVSIAGVANDSEDSFKSTLGDSVPAFLYMPVTAVLDFYNADGLDYVSIKADSRAQMDSAGVKAVRLLERRTGSSGKYYAENMAQQRSVLESVMRLISMILGAVAAISLVVGALGIMNIMMVSVTERTGEIGMMKAIGAKNSDIMLQFLMEAVVITLIGAVLGSLCGTGFGYLITKCAGLPFRLQPERILGVLGIVGITGLIFGVYPAKLAARLDPVEALR